MSFEGVYTDFFTKLREGLIDGGIDASATPTVEEEVAATGGNDIDILAALKVVLAPIKTIDDYEELVSIMESLADQITIRFLAMFFEVLVEVEERVWMNSVNKCPPIRDIYDKNCDLLLDNYEEFAYNYEKAIVDWTKQDGMFDDPGQYKFIVRRNRIYARYIVIAQSILAP